MDAGALGRRDPRVELLLPAGTRRGVGRAEAQPEPPNPNSAGRAADLMQIARARASPIAANPGAQAVAAQPPKGHHVDVRA